MFRATMGPSSRETAVFLQHLLLVIVCVWMTGIQSEFHPAYQQVIHTHTHTHTHTITSTKCRKNTVVSPDDGPIVARNF